MPASLKRNAALVFSLEVVFYATFMFAKHAPALRSIIPFGDDPYDAVGSFGVIAGLILAIVSVVRAFRPYGETAPSPAMRAYLLRTEMAVVLAVLITLAADAVALARHPGMWWNAPSRNELLALLAALGLAAVAVQAVLRASVEPADEARANWTWAVAVSLFALLALFLYPERTIDNFLLHLLAIVIADVLLFAPMRFLLVALVPDPASAPERVADRFWTPRRRWTIVVVMAAVIGALIFAAELREGMTLPLARVLLVATVYVGLTIAGLSIAYGFLATPLGLKAHGLPAGGIR